ncbi:MAG: hypothetical protein AABZ60_10310, partial [Planctomycetota bacterium]
QIPASLQLFQRGLGLLLETIYRPTETLLMQQARKAGIQVISGLDFFLRQAYFQQTLMTGTVYSMKRWKKRLLMSLRGA